MAAVVLYRARPAYYLLLRNAIFLSGAIGFVFFALLPVAPPRLVDPALLDTVTLHSSSYSAAPARAASTASRSTSGCSTSAWSRSSAATARL